MTEFLTLRYPPAASQPRRTLPGRARERPPRRRAGPGRRWVWGTAISCCGYSLRASLIVSRRFCCSRRNGGCGYLLYIGFKALVRHRQKTVT